MMNKFHSILFLILSMAWPAPWGAHPATSATPYSGNAPEAHPGRAGRHNLLNPTDSIALRHPTDTAVTASLDLNHRLSDREEGFPQSLNDATPEAREVNNPPVMAELMAGHRAWMFQTIVAKRLSVAPRFGFTGITNVQVAWDDPIVKDYVVQTQATFEFAKHFEAGLGFLWNPVEGVRPSANVSYAFGTPDLFLLTNLRCDLHADPNTELFLITEYRPKISPRWRLYTRFQGLYSMMPKRGDHARSYIDLRCGLTWDIFTFGAAANLDWYGPTGTFRNSIGGFLLVNLF